MRTLQDSGNHESGAETWAERNARLARNRMTSKTSLVQQGKITLLLKLVPYVEDKIKYTHTLIKAYLSATTTHAKCVFTAPGSLTQESQSNTADCAANIEPSIVAGLSQEEIREMLKSRTTTNEAATQSTDVDMSMLSRPKVCIASRTPTCVSTQDWLVCQAHCQSDSELMQQ